ncbi:MAG TPA: hypothetical protein VNO14_00585 [Blastocatellia bacterium]|nr:hypothetical protein [Blastocatellia bacterium]
MLMADTMAIFFVVLGFMLAFPGLWLLCRGLWPGRVAASAARCSEGLVKPFLAGLPVTFIFIFAAAALNNLPGVPAKIAALVVLSAYLIHAHAGVAGLATCIGERLKSPSDAERPWRSTLRGAVVLELSYLLPVLGWFIILPFSFIIGAGAAALSMLRFRIVSATPSRSTITAGSEMPHRAASHNG